MFKLIAVKILEGCVSHIKKCLKDNTIYYLSNEYIISDSDKSIKKRSEYLDYLPESFFNPYTNKSKLNINISAIVGMNGDGKSTLVEIIIRLLNNSAIEFEMNPSHNLVNVDGICAELYFIYNKKYYVLSQNDKDITLSESTRDGLVLIDKDKAKTILPYTMVSNYSHYAYNVNELTKEFNNIKNKCWLEEVFHKNDGYQSPISIHPYRNNGNIDINNEKYLSSQRLLSLFLNSEKASNGTISFRNINNKQATYLCITDVGYSKLLKKTIEDYFILHKETNLLSELIDKVENLDKAEIEEQKSTVKETKSFLDNLYYKIYKPNNALFDEISLWSKERHIISSKSDLRNLLDLIQSKISFFTKEDIDNWISQFMNLMNLNLCQIQRIELIDDIYDMWKTDYIKWEIKLNKCPNLEESINKSYEDFTTNEKCLHYIIYKTISIFETYPHYGMPSLPYENSIIHFVKAANFKLNYAMEILKKEWKDQTHITLKLRQAYKYYNSNKIYDLKEKNDRAFINIDDLKIMGIDFNNLENLPPRIFNSEIYFTTKDEMQRIPFDSFSSGEKQKLHSLGAILYHIRNIDSISKSQSNLIKYSSLNIILEEIELYFHPEWQRTFIYELLSLLHNSNYKTVQNINLIFVTHSPFILSDIPKSNVLFLQNGMPNDSMQENTFGANINSMLKNGFFLPSLPMGEFAYNKINSLFSRLNSHEFRDDDLETMYQEIIRIGEPYIKSQLLNLIGVYRSIASDSKLKKIVEDYINNIKHD